MIANVGGSMGKLVSAESPMPIGSPTAGLLGFGAVISVIAAPAVGPSVIASTTAAAFRLGVTAAEALAGRTRASAVSAAIRRIRRRYPRAASEGKFSASILDGSTVRGPRANMTQPARPPASSAGISGRL